MKKSIVCLGMVLISFTNGAFASNQNTEKSSKKEVVVKYDNISPLNIAITKGDIESVIKFVEYGASTNQMSNGLTPLMFAARYNKVEILNYLLSKGANPKIKDENGFTALKHAEISSAKDTALILKQI